MTTETEGTVGKVRVRAGRAGYRGGRVGVAGGYIVEDMFILS